jgi:hypothetical protein
LTLAEIAALRETRQRQQEIDREPTRVRRSAYTPSILGAFSGLTSPQRPRTRYLHCADDRTLDSLDRSRTRRISNESIGPTWPASRHLQRRRIGRKACEHLRGHLRTLDKPTQGLLRPGRNGSSWHGPTSRTGGICEGPDLVGCKYRRLAPFGRAKQTRSVQRVSELRGLVHAYKFEGKQLLQEGGHVVLGERLLPTPLSASIDLGKPSTVSRIQASQCRTDM